MDRNNRKIKQGTIVSSKMDKTVVVQVTRQLRHPLYGKLIKKWKKYYAHDENNQAQEGQVVKIMETRPMSKLKRWRVVEIINKE